MHDLVRHIFHNRLLAALRIPSFAGNGLPERMRSISFALLGLTAAAGLAMVAIFAQPGFSVLSPAPLPDEPSATQAIAGAHEVPAVHAPVALTAARPAPAKQDGAPAAGASPQSTHPGPTVGGGGSDQSQAPPAEADVPASVGAPEPSSGNSSGGGAGKGTEGGSGPASTGTPEQPASASDSSPPPSAPKPQPIVSAPKPEPAPAPGNSSSAAAAEHASERGIEASASHGPPASTAATVPAAPEASPSPGNGNGLAKGLDK
jgi:hypothetical protein